MLSLLESTLSPSSDNKSVLHVFLVWLLLLSFVYYCIDLNQITYIMVLFKVLLARHSLLILFFLSPSILNQN
jgi:hypothetical protein